MNKTFLRWILIFIMVLSGGYMSFNIGLIHKLYEEDSSKISFLILIIFLLSSIWCGIKTFLINKVKDINDNYSEFGWFFSGICTKLGLLGTVWGMILLSQSFQTLNTKDVSLMKTALAEIGAGLSVALYTTLVGILCAIILSVQTYNLENGIKNLKNG